MSFNGAAPGAISFNKDAIMNHLNDSITNRLDEAGLGGKSSFKPAIIVEMQKRITQLSE